MMLPKRIKAWIRVSACLTIAVCALWLSPLIWGRICGNRPIAFYGRVVDESGHPISRVKIEVQIAYSPGPALPVIYGRPERVRVFYVLTDEDGRFEISSQSGYSLSLRTFGTSRGELSFLGIPPYPQTNWSLDNADDRAHLPSRRSSTITFPMTLQHY